MLPLKVMKDTNIYRAGKRGRCVHYATMMILHLTWEGLLVHLLLKHTIEEVRKSAKHSGSTMRVEDSLRKLWLQRETSGTMSQVR